MKIAVLGSNGFVGSNLTNYLNNFYDVNAINRKSLDLLSHDEVKKYLEKNCFDVIINCATTMIEDQTSLVDTRNNLSLFMNFFNNSNLFGKFINLGSAAEYDRLQNIENIEEEQIFNRLPIDSYGYGQNIKTRLCYEKGNFFGLKIFNCFGKGEKETRVFPRMLTQKNFTISDRYFDFFYIKDLCTVVDHHIKGLIPLECKDINCVYQEKVKISEACKKFIKAQRLKTELIFEKESNISYTGSGTKLQKLNLPLLGLEKGMEDYNL
jgi:nucleoside-diphosphate-sugar epimerase